MTVRVLLEPPPPAAQSPARRSGLVDRLRWLLLIIGIAALGYSGYVYLDSHVYQAYEDWSFDREVAVEKPSVPAGPAPEQPRPKPSHADDSLIGRIAIPRLGVRAIVREGVDERTLRRAIGHVPETVRPGMPGNAGLAGHRDTFFRRLKGIRKNDKIVIETLSATYEYEVESMTVVSPADVEVLAPTAEPVLTLITCYPFHYVGNAPRRYVVRARQVTETARTASLPQAGS